MRDQNKFNKLKNKWYAKLKASGFVDIEQDEMYLKQSSGRVSLSPRASTNTESDDSDDRLLVPQFSVAESARFKYYSDCRGFVENGKFKNKTFKTIFSLHTDGMSIRDIEAKLGISRRKVHDIIRKIVKGMYGT